MSRIIDGEWVSPESAIVRANWIRGIYETVIAKAVLRSALYFYAFERLVMARELEQYAAEVVAEWEKKHA